MKNIELEIMNIMDKIEYGWVDKNGVRHDEVDESFSDNYILQAPDELKKSKLGVCWDQVELERSLFLEHDINITTYFIVHYDEKNCPTHTFLTFEKDNKIYWFEHSWKKFRGIYQYDSLNQLLLDIRNKFIEFELNNDYINDNLMIFEYKKPNSHINVQEFYKHCECGARMNTRRL